MERGSSTCSIGVIGLEGGEETVKRMKDTGGDTTFVKGNTSKAIDVEALVNKVVGIHRPIDCSFNIVVIEGPVFSSVDYTEEDFDRVVATGLTRAWLCMKFRTC